MAAIQAKMGPFHIIVRPVPRLFIMTSISNRQHFALSLVSLTKENRIVNGDKYLFIPRQWDGNAPLQWDYFICFQCKQLVRRFEATLDAIRSIISSSLKEQTKNKKHNIGYITKITLELHRLPELLHLMSKISCKVEKK